MSPTAPTIKRKELLAYLRERFTLDWNGIHGAAHWGRVKLNGLNLARETGANVCVVELFAMLHDACRENDGSDPSHGARAASLATQLRGHFYNVNDGEMHLLETACQGHTAGVRHEDITVSTCWDADRLDLWRVGIRPDQSRLLTAPARRVETIGAAVARADAWLQRRHGVNRA